MTGQRIGPFSGWDAAWREPSLPQPGGRDRAPGDLVCVQAFINSHYDLELDHGADLFASPATLAAWLAQRGMLTETEYPRSIPAADMRRAVAVREGLRALARRNGNPEPRDVAGALGGLNQAAAGIPLHLRFGDDGPRFFAGGGPGLDRAIAAVLAITARAMIDGSWARLKVCPGEECGWAFYDHSRNQSGRWCSMAVCGGRSKARAHYRRRRGGD
jgi:predicted RNA-binding Zn ribbon-like protein